MFRQLIFKSSPKSMLVAFILLALFLATSTISLIAQDNDSTACTVNSSATVNLRDGPGTDFAQSGQMTAGQTGEVDGQILGTDGFVWWRLTSGVWVRSDVVDESGDCETVPTIVPDDGRVIYDDFNDPSFDGTFNRLLWEESFLPDGCSITQEDETLKFTNTNTASDCSISVGQPLEVRWNELGSFEARIRVPSGVNLDTGAQRIVIFTADRQGGLWGAYCGLEQLSSGQLVSRFFVWNGHNGVGINENYEYDINITAEFDRWYTFRIETDPITRSFMCYVDNDLVGTHSTNDIDYINSIGFFTRTLESTTRTEGTMFVAYVDDVGITLPDPYLYDDFNDPEFDGSLNDELWSPNPDCGFFQADGVMVLGNPPNPDVCLVNLIDLPPERYGNLGGFEAKIMIPRASAGGFVGQTLSIYTDDVESGHWAAGCGLYANDTNIQLHFDAFLAADDPADTIIDRNVDRPAQFDRWYTIRLEIDPISLAVACVVDGQPFDSVIPQEVDVLEDANFIRRFKIDRGNLPTSTTYVDDVRIIPPAE